MLALLAQAGEGITTDELRQTLRGLGEPYSVIADKGTRRPKLDDTPTIQTIVQRLRGAGIIARIEPAGAAHIRAYLHKT